MEPVDYLKVFKNHWKVVVALTVIAMVGTFYASPSQATKAYKAEHVVLLDTVAGGDEGGRASNSNPSAAAIFLDAGVVPQRAAEIVGFDGDPNMLAQKITKVVEPDTGLITITATAGSPAEAINIANAFGTEFIKYIAEREQQRIATDTQEAQVKIDDLQRTLDDLRIQDANDPADMTGEIKAAEDRLGEAVNAAAAAQDMTSYVTLREAVTASQDAGFVSGFGRVPRSLFMGVVGALLGFGVAIMLDRSDSRLRTKDQVERRFGLPVLAEIPLLALRDRSRAAVVAFEREPRVAEAYRGLRTALLLFRTRTEPTPAANGNGHSNGHSAAAGSLSASSVRQLVVVTSPEAGDGKSTTTANLAMAYAEAGQSVLLVSWDLWRPLSPGVFDAQEGPGVADYLDGNASSLVRYVQDTSIPGVRIVTAGLGGHHPYTQIENARRLLEEARTLANIVIVDTAPILSASVTRELVTLADAVVVVCRSGRTTGPAADRCAELLERLGAPALGVVLVGVPTGPFADYYGAPPKGSRGLERAGFRRRQSEDAGARHKAAAASGGGSTRPTSALYRATAPRGSEGRETR